MIQYYLDLKKQVSTINGFDLIEGQIQKIYSTAFYICLTIRARGKTWFLYLGRGGGHEGVWLHETPPPSPIRRKDNFLEYLRRHLTSCSFRGISIDQHDRILKLDYQKFGQAQAMLWFWKGRKLYFLHYFQDAPESPFKLLLSWKGKAIIPGADHGDLFEYFDEVGRSREMKHDLISKDPASMSRLIEEEMKAAAIKSLSTAPAFLKRKKENIEDDLRKARQWEKLQSILDKGDSLENIYELKIADQKIKFEGELNPYERRNLVFQKIKKLKRGEKILQERLGSVEEELKGKEKQVISESMIPIIKPVWGEEKTGAISLSRTVQNEFKIFLLPDCQVGVGLNAQGNDQLRNKWASKEDHWIHLDGLKSTHVIIKLPPGKPLMGNILNIGATIVAHFSHFNDEWIPIIHTQVKNLKGVSGAAGMVIYKKEKHLRCPRVDVEQLLKE